MANRTWGRKLGVAGQYDDAANWVTTTVPTTGDHVRIPYGSLPAITLGLNQSAVTIGDFIVEQGAPAIGITPDSNGGTAAYLQIDPDRFVFDGTADSFIDLSTANISAQVDGTSSPSTGERGLYLKGSDLVTLAINGGSVGLAWLMGETATAVTVAVSGSSTSAWIGAGTTLTTFRQSGGNNVVLCSHTNCHVSGGLLVTKGAATITTCNVYPGAYFYPCSTGTITTLNVWKDAVVDFTQCLLPRTVTTINIDPGAQVKWDPAVMTFTNAPVWTGPVSVVSSGTTDAGSFVYSKTVAY